MGKGPAQPRAKHIEDDLPQETGAAMAIERQSSPKMGSSGGGSNADSTGQQTRNYLKETITELKKTTWPTTQEANRLTLVVIAVIVVLGIYMGGLDAILSFLVSRFSLIR
jgi:preprotein translocase SecE subunit